MHYFKGPGSKGAQDFPWEPHIGTLSIKSRCADGKHHMIG